MQDESYTLTIDSSATATIDANTIYGAMHGLETFSQVVVWNETAQTYQISYVPMAIQDSPRLLKGALSEYCRKYYYLFRFPWRGLMMDTARHFQTKATILRTLDAMSYSKVCRARARTNSP